MSDPPPRPKPGSLRDRIAAFESQASQPPGLTPPPPRPKPGGLQWKPKQPPPPSSNDNVSLGTGAGVVGAGATGGGSNSTATSPSAASFTVEKPKSPVGMSATDARESIKQGGSLKERMAALKGKGAFGGPLPPSQGGQGPIPPVAPKPKWKPPPQVSVVPAEGEKEEKKEGEEEEKEEEEDVKEDRKRFKEEEEESGGLEAGAPSEAPQVKTATESSEVSTHEEGEQAAVDPQEEERQRRAAIAARMAKLGGARVGMAAPGMYGGARPSPPPLDKKPQAPKEPEPTAVLEGAEKESESEVEFFFYLYLLILCFDYG